MDSDVVLCSDDRVERADGRSWVRWIAACGGAPLKRRDVRFYDAVV